MTTVDQVRSLIRRHGSPVTYHRETGGEDCPCVSPEGYRNLKWHRDNPDEPVCTESGKLNPVVTRVMGRAFVQPVQSGAVRRLTGEYFLEMFGQIQVDDHLAIFPIVMGTRELDFFEWPASGTDYILYDERRFIVVSANRIPAPDNGKRHHWEVGLRLVKNERPNDNG